jgi:hypothetical protein
MKYYPIEVNEKIGSNRIMKDELDGKYYSTTNYFKGIGFDTEEEAQKFIDEVLKERDYIDEGVVGYEIECSK